MSKETTKQLAVEPNDIYHVDKSGLVWLGGNPITKEELSSLQEEIKYLERCRIWGILTNTVADKAKEIMFEKSESFDDMRTGKAMLFNIQQMKKIIRELKSLEVKKK